MFHFISCNPNTYSKVSPLGCQIKGSLVSSHELLTHVGVKWASVFTGTICSIQLVELSFSFWIQEKTVIISKEKGQILWGILML